VSLLISAYNEEGIIEEKILNSLELNYPKELLEIVVVSDGSSDRTNEIVERYHEKGVILKHYDGRIGKTACLNRAMKAVRGDIIVFSDANSKYDRNAIAELEKHFQNEEVGFVTGRTKYVSQEGSKVLDTIGVYSSIEELTKKLESKIGSCVGADGALFAIRNNLYKELKDSDINDLVIPFSIVKRGFKGVFEEKAICYEGVKKTKQGEFSRQVRITSRTIRAIVNNRELLNPFRFGMFAFELISHKVCKLFVPFLLLILLGANIALIKNSVFYVCTLAGQLVFYAFACLGYLQRNPSWLTRISHVCSTFLLVNLAILKGWIKFLKGETYVTWGKTE
jgi:cellulose synthase/poly-beta-1,6-N-acetylglucosamine synthase-like glycosyltransferase